MKEIPSLLLDTRDEVILRHLERYLRATGGSEEKISIRIQELLLARTPERALVARDFPLTDDPFHLQAQGGQKIRRWAKPSVSARMSIGVEEAVVLALDEPYRQQCCQELAQRMGGFFLPAPDASAPEVTSVADLLQQVGEAVQAWAQLAVDGINAKDEPALIRKTIREVDDVIGRGLSMKRLLETALVEAEAARSAP